MSTTKNEARGILLLASFLCGKCRAAAARKAACNGEREYIAAFAKGGLPVRDVRAGAEGAALRAAKCCDHRVDIERGVIAKFLHSSTDGERNADKVHAVHGKQVAA